MAQKVRAPTMEQVATAPLNDMLASVTALSTLLSNSNSTSTYSSLPGIISSLITADDSLTSTLTTLRQHQTNYARLLELRAKADGLDNDIRTILQKADRLRTEIGQIHRGILDDTDDEEQPNDVDYDTLLAFAARIGKHNLIAAQEADRESDRRALESRGTSNGQSVRPSDDDIAQQKVIMDHGIAQQRAAMGMAFPDNTILRLGALGRLQMFREGDRGEAAVDDEIARLVTETEAVAKDGGNAAEIQQARAQQEEKEKRDREWREREAAKRKAAAAKAKEAGAGKPSSKQPKTLSLDFDDDSDDDDD